MNTKPREGREFALDACALETGFLRSAERFPDRPALEAAGQVLSYSELKVRALALASTLGRHSIPRAGFTGIYASRTPTAYAGLLAALFRGHAYVPLNPRFPAARTQKFIDRTGCQALIVDDEGKKSLAELLGGVNRPLVILLPEEDHASEWQPRFPQHTFLGREALEGSEPVLHRPPDLDSPAYVLFTSGSTGEPKGVVITHRNIGHLLRTMVERYGMNERDRVSQFADLTFDPSVFDVFAAWACGACVCCPDASQLVNAANYLGEARITIFQSVPSNGLMMKQLGALKPDRFPDLRVTFFGGEPLPVELVEAWQAAAPRSVIENLYGPTEVTVNSTAYRWHPEHSPAECEQGIVPVGTLLPGVRGLVVDEELRPVPAGEQGELLLAGPQRTPGYIKDPERNTRALVKLPGSEEIYYRTGDLVRQPPGKTYFIFHGRKDHQVKIFGMRIELGEIEAVLREEAGTAEAAVIGWPVTSTGVGGLCGFVASANLQPEELRQRLAQRLPQQMVPRQIHLLERLPLNINGKIDRRALQALLEQMT